MMSRSNLLSDNLELGKLQQQLFGTSVAELNRCLGILTCSFNPDDGSNTKTLMLYLDTLMKITQTGICRHRTWSHSLMQSFEVWSKWIYGFLGLSRGNHPWFRIGPELCSHWSWILHPFRTPASSERGSPPTRFSLDFQQLRINVANES